MGTSRRTKAKANARKNARTQIIVATGISGCGRKEYLEAWERYAKRRGKKVKIFSVGDLIFKHAEAIVFSMTPEERRRPELINGSRRRRIALGSGTTPQDVNQLLKQWKEAKKIMQMMASGRTAKLLGIR